MAKVTPFACAAALATAKAWGERLHAWDILRGGDIACLLPAATGKNWLPDDYKARNRRADKMGIEA